MPLAVEQPASPVRWLAAAGIGLAVNVAIFALLTLLGLSSIVPGPASDPAPVIRVKPDLVEVELNRTPAGGAPQPSPDTEPMQAPQPLIAPPMIEPPPLDPIELPPLTAAPDIEPIRVNVDSPQPILPPPEKPKPRLDARQMEMLLREMGLSKGSNSSKGGLGSGDGVMAGTGSGADGKAELNTNPRFIREVKPEYPLAAKRRGIEGYVTVKLDFNEQGRIVRYDVVDWQGDSSFVDAVRRVITLNVAEPLIRNGRAVPYTAKLTIRFKLGS
jgi:protein TonB